MSQSCVRADTIYNIILLSRPYHGLAWSRVFMIPLIERTPSLIELDPVVRAPAALPDRIYATLKHRILTCSMPPGERIAEKELCKEKQVSRTPLREAFNRLALEGLIIQSRFRGYSVAPVGVAAYKELCEL